MPVSSLGAGAALAGSRGEGSSGGKKAGILEMLGDHAAGRMATVLTARSGKLVQGPNDVVVCDKRDPAAARGRVVRIGHGLLKDECPERRRKPPGHDTLRDVATYRRGGRSGTNPA